MNPNDATPAFWLEIIVEQLVFGFPPLHFSRFDTQLQVGPLLDIQGAKRAAMKKVKKTSSKISVNASEDGLLDLIQSAKSQGREIVFASMGTVGTSNHATLGWNGRRMDKSGLLRGLRGRDLCHAAWGGMFDTFGQADANAGPLIVVSIGPQPGALTGLDPPPNAICLPFVPQGISHTGGKLLFLAIPLATPLTLYILRTICGVDLLKAGLSVFLTHGGQNSFMESLAEVRCVEYVGG